MYIQCKCFSSLHFSHVSNSCLENLHLLAGGEKHLLPTYLMINHDLLNCQRGHCYKMFSHIKKSQKNHISINMKVCGSARPITDSVGFPDTRRQVSTCGRMTRKSWARQKRFTKFSGIELSGASRKKVRSLLNVNVF